MQVADSRLRRKLLSSLLIGVVVALLSPALLSIQFFRSAAETRWHANSRINLLLLRVHKGNAQYTEYSEAQAVAAGINLALHQAEMRDVRDIRWLQVQSPDGQLQYVRKLLVNTHDGYRNVFVNREVKVISTAESVQFSERWLAVNSMEPWQYKCHYIDDRLGWRAKAAMEVPRSGSPLSFSASIAVGWPLKSFKSSRGISLLPSQRVRGLNEIIHYDNSQGVLTRGITVPLGPVHTGLHPFWAINIPTRPVILGLMVNWILFTIGIFVVRILPRTVMQLLNHMNKRCPTCGYNWKGLSRCPECGRFNNRLNSE